MLARVAINYRRELTQDDDVVVVRCAVERIGTSSVTLREEIRTLAGELAAEAEAVLVARDPADGPVAAADGGRATRLRARQSEATVSAVKVAVVGAGFAGLAAADALAGCGYRRRRPRSA